MTCFSAHLRYNGRLQEGCVLCRGVRGCGGERGGPKTNGEKRGKNPSFPSVKPVQRKKMVVHNNIKITSFPFFSLSYFHLITKTTSFPTKHVIFALKKQTRFRNSSLKISLQFLIYLIMSLIKIFILRINSISPLNFLLVFINE